MQAERDLGGHCNKRFLAWHAHALRRVDNLWDRTERLQKLGASPLAVLLQGRLRPAGLRGRRSQTRRLLHGAAKPRV
eukprot:363868-Chlamydomonas_euryale.AAC.5